MAKILVTGGAGYVGSHVCKALRRAGHVAITFDNFSTGWRDAVRFGPLAEGDLRDIGQIEMALGTHQPDAVMHLAALSDIAQSMREPELYFAVNVKGTANLLAAMARFGVRNLVFSSTCAVYRPQSAGMLNEASDLLPNNVYGQSKLEAEKLIGQFGQSGRIRSVILRYFNVAGADSEAELGEFHRPESHLVPLALEAASGGPPLVVFGDDYATADGTCIRDFVHVEDLAAGHLGGMRWQESSGSPEIFNLGSGTGYSVLQVLNMAGAITGKKVPFSLGARRPGDCPVLVAANDKATRMMGWQPRKTDIRAMIDDAWKWFQTPGYAR